MTRLELAVRLALPSVCIAAFAALAAAAPAVAAPAPFWHVLTRSAPTTIAPGQLGAEESEIVNFGQTAIVGTKEHPVVVTDRLPSNVAPRAITVKGVPRNIFMTGQLGTNGEAQIVHFEDCEETSKQTPVAYSCDFIGTLPPYVPINLEVPVTGEEGPAATPNTIEVQGGNATSKTVQAEPPPPGDTGGFGIERYELSPETENGEVDRQAGSHPFQLTTTIAFNEAFGRVPTEATELPINPGLVRDISTTLPPGLVGDTNYVKPCSGTDFSTVSEGNFTNCPEDTAIGVAIVTYRDPTGESFHYATETIPVFDVEPSPGEPVRLGFDFEKVPVALDTAVKTGEGYAVKVSSTNTSASAEVMSATIVIWGVTGSPAHALARGYECIGGGVFSDRQDPRVKTTKECEEGAAKASKEPQLPYLTLPARCEAPPSEPGALTSTVEVEPWGEGAKFVSGPSSTLELAGCGELPFNSPGNEPRLSVTPFTHEASTPTGLKDVIEVPQRSLLEPVPDESDSEPGKAEADISKTVLTLPPGVLSNAGLANGPEDKGLQTCSIATAGFGGGQFQGTVAELETKFKEEGFAEGFEGKIENGLDEAGAAFESELVNELDSQQFTPEPSGEHENREPSLCRNPSKIGDVKIVSPLLKEPIEGSLYLAKQDTSPFRPSLVVYLMAYNKTLGIRVKLAGEVKILEDGQLISTFAGTPPVPFEKLEVTLPNEENGERAANSTPAQCGAYESTAAFTTFSAAGETTVHSSPSEFEITSGPNGSPCPPAQLEFHPSFSGGSTVKQAGALTPFTTTIGHADGQQAIKTIDLELPPGAAALISQVTPCPEATALQDACGPESLVGHTTSVSGLGGKPVTLQGELFLTGALQANSHHGAAPFGLLAVTHAVAGPFNLGDVNVLSTIKINEFTTAATVESEPIPQFVDGVPSQLKEVNVTVERPGNQPFQFNPTNCEKLELKGSLTGYEGGSSPISEPFYVTGCASLPFAPKITASAAAQGSKFNGTTFKVTVESPGLGQANIHKVDLTLPAQLPSRQSTIEKACLAQVFDANPAACDEGSDIGEGIVQTPVFKNPLRGPAYLVSHGAAEFPDVEFVLQGEGVTVILDGKTDIKKGITFSKFETSPDAPFTKFESIFPEGPHSALTTFVPEVENYNLCKHTLSIPTEVTGQNGAFISQTTPVTLIGCSGVKSNKVTKLTKAQLLAKALKACKKDKKRSKRVACEKAAHKKYGSHAKKSSHKSKKASKTK
jgi:hypothetical protein